MSFSRRQQPAFQSLVQKAWKRWLGPSRAAEFGGAVARRAWYEEELEKATGQRSSMRCNTGRDYDRAMAHFERLADDGSFEWQLKAAKGDATRILHVIRQKVGEFDLDERYMLGIAERAIGFRPAALEELSPELLMTILRALLIQLQRQARRLQQTSTVQREEEPF